MRRVLTTLGLTCASNMQPPGRELQGEWHGAKHAYRVRSNPGLDGDDHVKELRIAGPYLVEVAAGNTHSKLPASFLLPLPFHRASWG